MRPGRAARAHQPARIFPRMFAVSRMRLHSGYGGGNPRGRRKQDRVLRELREGNGAEPRDEKCPLDGNGLVKKHGRFGEFIGCSGYPKCKYTRPITMGIKCPKCNEG